MNRFRLLVLFLPLLLTACGLSDQQKADYSAVERSGAPAAIYDKMVHGDDLSLYDIKALAHFHVNSGVVLRYLRDRQTVYVLNTDDVKGLVAAGVSQSVIDYMLSTPQTYGGPPVVVGVGYGPYWGPYPYPYYYGGYWGGYRGGYRGCGPYHHW